MAKMQDLSAKQAQTGKQEVFASQNQAEVAEWMRRVEEFNAQQVKYAKKQYLMAGISAACSICMLLAVIICGLVLMPKLLDTFEQIDMVMTNLEDVSAELAEADLAGMLEEVSTLVGDSQAGVSDAINKISTLDIDTMNEAIQDLKAVVEPLAKLFGR